jgi:osmoprotectant transport system permease protein
VEQTPLMVANVFLDAFRFIPAHATLLLEKTSQLSQLAFTALGIVVVLALPLGLWLGHRHRGLFLALGVSSIGRAVPTIALIGVMIGILGVGFWSNTVALVVLGIPPLLTNTYFAIEGVEVEAVEAARGMGLTEPQILTRVELPLGLPLIIAGFRLSAVFVIATATIAGLAGGGGLGDIMANQVTYGLPGTLAAALCVTAVALLTAGLLSLAQRAAFRRMTPNA